MSMTDEVFDIESRISQTQERLVAKRTLVAHPSLGATEQHANELRKLAMNELGVTSVRTSFDESRKIWQAWAGGETFSSSPFRGEWGTEFGAIRRLLNLKGKWTKYAAESSSRSDASAMQRPHPEAVHVIDALASRKLAPKLPLWRRTLNSVVRVTVAVAAVLVVLGAAGIIVRDWLRPATRPVMAAMPRPEPEVPVTVASVPAPPAAPIPEEPRRRRRRVADVVVQP